MKKQNRKRALVGAFLMLLVLISGTFAAVQLNQGAFNPVRVVAQYGGRLHDDFEDRDGPGELDKDVFAENFNERDLMVRIRFREFLELYTLNAPTGNIRFGPNTVDISDHTTWPIVLFNGWGPLVAGVREPIRRSGVGIYSHDIANFMIGGSSVAQGQIGWTLGNPADVQKIFMPTHNHVNRRGVQLMANLLTSNELQNHTVFSPADAQFFANFANTTGRGGDWLAGHVPGGLDNASLTVEDFLNLGVQTGASVSDGTHDFWTVGDQYCSLLIYINTGVTPNVITISRYPVGSVATVTAAHPLHVFNPVAFPVGFPLAGQPQFVCHVAQPTLPVHVAPAIPGLFNGVITLADWNAAGNPPGNFWILDNTDNQGWFYWNGYLEGTTTRAARAEAAATPNPLDLLPTTATSLLLNGIDVPDHVDLSYIIHVEAQWFTLSNMPSLAPLPNAAILNAFTNTFGNAIDGNLSGLSVGDTVRLGGIDWLVLNIAAGNATMIATDTVRTPATHAEALTRAAALVGNAPAGSIIGDVAVGQAFVMTHAQAMSPALFVNNASRAAEGGAWWLMEDDGDGSARVVLASGASGATAWASQTTTNGFRPAIIIELP